MKHFYILLLSFLPFVGYSQEQQVKTTQSNFSISSELTSKYVWRGIEYGNAPVIFGTLNYSYKGLSIFATGGYAFNGRHSEVDLGLSYSHKWLTVGLSDYYFPSASGENDKYFNFKNSETRHSVEFYATVAPEKVPFWLTMSTYVYGADKDLNGEQAFSSYLELGYSHCFNERHTLALSVGANLNKSFYTSYEDGFNVTNITLKYSTAIPLGKFNLPVSGSLIFNPYTNKPFFSLSIYFSSK